jgi:hypothetical protein
VRTPASRAPHISNVSAQVNATSRISYRVMLAPPAFLALGPLLGLLLMSGGEGPSEHLWLVLPFAYMVVGVPALISGLLYSALCLIHRLLLPGRDVSLVVSAAMGALSGLVGMMYFAASAGGPVFPSSVGLTQFFAIGVAAGAACSVFASALVSLKSSSRTSPKAQEVGSLEKTALVSSTGRLTEPHGLCPKCQAVVPLSALNCPRCDALFGTHASWRPEPLSSQRLAAVEAALTGHLSGSPGAPAELQR